MARALPPGLRYPVGATGGTAWYLGSPAQRRHALGNYAAVLGLPETHPQVARVARRAFENYGRMLVDFVLLGAMRPHELLENVTVDRRDRLDAALQGGRGCILAVPHMGSWDIVGSYAAVAGYRVTAVAQRFPGSLDQAVVEARTRFGLEVIPLGRAAVRGIKDALGANKILGLLSDLPPPGGGGVEVRFFGRRALVPSGPAAFACRHGAPLVPAGIYRVGPGRYHVRVGEPIMPPTEPCAGREGAMALMQRVVEHFESYIRDGPDQWYAFKKVLAEPIG